MDPSNPLDDLAIAAGRPSRRRPTPPPLPTPMSKGIIAAWIFGSLAVVGMIGKAINPPAVQQIAEPIPQVAAQRSIPSSPATKVSLFDTIQPADDGKTVFVRGYFRKDGTYVRPYYRHPKK